MTTQGIGTNACHASSIATLATQENEREKKEVTLWVELKQCGAEHFTIAMLAIANLANSHVGCCFLC